MVFKRTKSIPWWNLDVGNKGLRSLCGAYKNKFLSNGPIGPDFQNKLEKFLNVKHVSLTTSGSTSLLIALKVLGVQEGNEVIVPDRTFQATAHAAYFLGANVKCAEVDSERGLITAETIRPLIGEKTKAIIVVHLNGRAVDLDPILELARKNNIYIVEDVAQGFGSLYQGKRLGSLGDISCFSFGVTKFLTMGQGGAIATNNNIFHERIQHYLYQGQTGDDDKRFDSAGLNFRMSNLLVSLGVPQFLNFEKNKKKFIDVYALYQKLLAPVEQIQFIPTDTSKEIPIWVEVLADDRDELYAYLKNQNIETVKFYPSIHEAVYLGLSNVRFHQSDKFKMKGLILPSGLNLSVDSIKKVSKFITNFYKSK